jgi:hypothetical protein
LKHWTLSGDLIGAIERAFEVPEGALPLSSYFVCDRWRKTIDLRDPDRVVHRDRITFTPAGGAVDTAVAVDLRTQPLQLTYRSVGTIAGGCVTSGLKSQFEPLSSDENHKNSRGLKLNPFRLSIDLSSSLSGEEIVIKNEILFHGGFRNSPDSHMHFDWPVRNLRLSYFFNFDAVTDLSTRYIPRALHVWERGAIRRRNSQGMLVLRWKDSQVGTDGTYEVTWNWKS